MIMMVACPQLMRRAVDSRAIIIAWRRADTDSSPAILPYILWKLHGRYKIYGWNIVQTKMQNKIQILRHFKIKFRPLAELDPTRPDPPFPVNFLTRPDPRVGSRVVQLWSHLYADDTQFYDSCRLDDTVALRSRLSCCADKINLWCKSRHLQLNASKTELIWFGSQSNLAKLSRSDCTIQVGSSTIHCRPWPDSTTVCL